MATYDVTVSVTRVSDYILKVKARSPGAAVDKADHLLGLGALEDAELIDETTLDMVVRDATVRK
jgi:hypothetical protein